MLVSAITGAWTSGTPLTLSTPTVSTNENVILNTTNNGLLFKAQGWYKVRLQAVATATGTSIGAELSANGNVIPLTEVTITTVADGNAEIYIEYPIHIKSASASTYALVQVVPTGAGTTVNGYVFVDKME